MAAAAGVVFLMVAFFPARPAQSESGHQVDIILTLDRSDTMAVFFERYFDGLDALCEALSGSGLDFHLAVAVNDDGCIVGPDPYIDSTYSIAHAAETLEVMSDISGVASNVERGFSLAEAALSAQNAGPGGCNEGLLREEATLFLVHISDEPEQSEHHYTYYVDLFRSLKDHPKDVIMNAIAGDYPSGCGSAMPGTGYYEAASATGGLFLSICAANWAPHFEELVEACAAGAPPPTGDINDDGTVDVGDGMLALQVLARMDIPFKEMDSRAEVNGDGCVGLAEALYALRKAAGLDELPALVVFPVEVIILENESEASVTISNGGGGLLSWNIPVLPSWITGVSMSSGGLQAGESVSVTFTADRSGLDPGQSYEAEIPVLSNGGEASIYLRVDF
jgi:hypothetical protein